MRELLHKMKVFEQIENLKNYYSRLSEREQMIFSLSVAGGGLFLLFLIYSILLAANVSMSNRIQSNRKSLQTISQLGDKYRSLDQKIGDIERLIAQTPANFQLATELEMLAQQNQVKIESIKDRPGSPHEFYTETQAFISIGDIQLRPLINFLFSIENSSKPMRISTLQIKPNYKDPKVLDVNFMVSTFRSQ